MCLFTFNLCNLASLCCISFLLLNSVFWHQRKDVMWVKASCSCQMGHLCSCLIQLKDTVRTYIYDSVACFQLSQTCIFTRGSFLPRSSSRSSKMADLYQFWGHGLEDRAPRRHRHINLELTRTTNLRYWVAVIETPESARRSSPGRRALYTGVSANCTYQLGGKEVQKASPKAE